MHSRKRGLTGIPGRRGRSGTKGSKGARGKQGICKPHEYEYNHPIIRHSHSVAVSNSRKITELSPTQFPILESSNLTHI